MGLENSQQIIRKACRLAVAAQDRSEPLLDAHSRRQKVSSSLPPLPSCAAPRLPLSSLSISSPYSAHLLQCSGSHVPDSSPRSILISKTLNI